MIARLLDNRMLLNILEENRGIERKASGMAENIPKLHSLNELAKRFENLPSKEGDISALEVTTKVTLTLEVSIQRQRDDDGTLTGYSIMMHFPLDESDEDGEEEDWERYYSYYA